MGSHIKHDARRRRASIFVAPATLAALTVVVGWVLYEAFPVPHMIAKTFGNRLVALVWGRGQVYVQYHQVEDSGSVLAGPRLAGSTVWFLDIGHGLGGQDGGLLDRPWKTRLSIKRVGNVDPRGGFAGQLSLPMGFLFQYGNGYRSKYLMPAYNSDLESFPHVILHAQAPLWFPVLILSAGLFYLTGAASRIRSRYRLKHGRCPVCNYDLRASPGRCPECGTPAAGRRGASV